MTMLQLNPIILDQVVRSAKLAAQGDSRWLNAIDRAARELVDNPYVDRLSDHLLIASPTSGQIYSANGVCQCKAYEFGQPCWHRAAARLVQRYDEAEARAAKRAAYEQAVKEMDELFA
jgi:hypothetical protein